MSTLDHIERGIHKILLDAATSPVRSARGWIENKELKFYIVCSPRYVLGHKYISTICLSNISISWPDRAKGWYLIVLRTLERYHTPIYIQNVTNPKLCPILEKLGYKRLEYFEGISFPSYFKENSRNSAALPSAAHMGREMAKYHVRKGQWL